MPTRLDLHYDREVLAVRTRVEAYAKRMWLGLPAYRDADAERLIAALVPRVEAAQVRIAQLTDAYISRVAATELGTAVRRGAVATVTTEALRGVPAVEVYRRPFATAYTELSAGASFTDAVTAGGARLLSIASSGMQLAKTHSARAAMERSGVSMYQRVLTGRENCALCVIASTQRYWRADLSAIHPACDCHVRPWHGDPRDNVIDVRLLERMHAAVGAEFGSKSDRGARLIDGLKTVTYSDGTRGADYTDLIVTRLHGELGPVLTWRHQHFTSASDLAA